MARGESQSRELPSFQSGFAELTPHSRWVNLAGYAVGLIIWLLTYWLGARLIAGSAEAVAARAAAGAAAVTSVYFVALFAVAIGSPFGNLFAPTLITVGLPDPVYRALLPSGVPNATEIVPFTPTILETHEPVATVETIAVSEFYPIEAY